jgi:hypothetical protein
LTSQNVFATTYTPAGAKLNWDGTLSATRVKVATKAQTSTRQLQPPENNILDEFRWANLAIYLNQAEPPSSPKALDQAIDNLIKDNPDYTIKHLEGTEYWTDVNYETGNESNWAESVIRIHVTWDN